MAYLAKKLTVLSVGKWIFYLFGICAFSHILPPPTAFGQADAGVVPNRILVKVEASLKAELTNYAPTQHPQLFGSDNTPEDILQFAQLNQRYGVRTIRRVFPASDHFEAAHRRFGLHRWYEVAFADTLSTEVQQVLAQYRAHPLVTLAEPVYLHSLHFAPSATGDTVITNDPRFAEQWPYRNTGQSDGTAAADIQLTAAWSVARGDDRVVVAVIDGGIDTEHEDLRAALWVNEAEQNGLPDIDDDGNGYVDDVHGYGFGDRRGAVASSNHGTHVAGVVGAVSDNGIGVAGVAGGSGQGDGVRLMSCAVFGQGSQGGFAEAFIYAADHGAVIAQNSWGGGDQSVLLEDAIRYFTERAGYDNSDEHFAQNRQIGPMAGGLVVFAAGNDRTKDAQQAYPASLPSVLTVAATDHDDHRSDFSNYGAWVDLSAPGTDVLSTYPNNSYQTISGTSMACPHVSGVAALLVARYQQPGLTPDHLRTLMLAGADPIDDRNPRYRGMLGRGRLNAYRSLTLDQAEAPGPVAALTAQTLAYNQVQLRWTTSGADGDRGTAAYYELRYATFPITSQNFNQATPVPTLRVPLSSGTLDTLTVTGLSPTTMYYFALRTRDLLGQVSPLSEVVTATTPAPPVMTVQPTSLSVSLNVGQVRRDTIVVGNTAGRSPLTFSATTVLAEAWLSLTHPSGVIAAGEQEALIITTDAGRLAEGIYRDTVLISSNDPTTPQRRIPVRITVVGVPQLSVSSSHLRLGNVWLSTPWGVDLNLRNVGTGTLRIDQVEVSGSGFTVAPSSLTLAPGTQRTLSVSFSPTTLGIAAGTLTLFSNDADQPRLDIPLTARVIPTPPFTLPLEPIILTVTRGDTLTRPIQLRSLSTDTLAWSLAAEKLPAGWHLTPTGGQLGPGDRTALLLTIDATTLAADTYQSAIIVRSGGDTSAVSVSLTVEEAIAPLAFAYDLPDQRLLLTDTVYTIDVATYLGEASRGVQYTAVSSDTARLQVALNGSSLKLYPRQVGTAIVMIVAQHDAASTDSTSFLATIVLPNRPPQVAAPPDSLLLVGLITRSLMLSGWFTDPDYDSLTYVAESSDPSVVEVRLRGDTLTITSRQVGQGAVVVYATDPQGARATLTLPVEATPITAVHGSPTSVLSLLGYPNPVADWLTIRYTLARTGPVRLVLLDKYGRPLRVWNDLPGVAGSHTLSYQTAGLPAGVYLLRLSFSSETVASRIVVR